jgi:large subunit ribosomal protein L29
MKASELTGMSDEQLAITLRDTEKHLFQLRFQSATDRLETPSEMRKARKDIARIKTVQRQRELAALAQAPDDRIAGMLAELEPKTEGPGKRKAKRQIARLTALREARQPKTAQPKTAQPKTAQPAKGK